MEGAQTALINRGDTGPYMKLLPENDHYNYGTQDESNYVELDNVLDMKSEGKGTLKVMITGDSNHLGIFKSKGDKSSVDDNGPSECELNLTNLPGKDCESTHKTYSGDITTEICVVGDFCYSEPMSPSLVAHSNGGFGDSPVSLDAITGPHTEIVPLNVKDPCNLKDVSSKIEELQYTDMYLYKDIESEDCESVILSDRNAFDSTEDESHFITTHEIQLTELDHDVDGDFELESCTDVEDDNLVYSFVDYASFDSDETIGADVEDDGSLAPVSSDQALSDSTAPCPASAPAVSARDGKDLGDSDKCISSDESLSKVFQNGDGNSAGQIHLSIKTTSRAINKSSGGKETENGSYLAKHEGDWSRYVYKAKDGKGDGTCGRANCFIPAPGRVHFGRKLKGRDLEYSSGASSSVSELDDADKEVRNLTARAFKSLACPYFDAISLTSSDSSVSEYGQAINNWPLHTGGRRLLSQKTSTFQASKNAGGIIGYTQAKLNSLFAVNGSFTNAHKPSSATKKVEFNGQLSQGQSAFIALAETVNFRCRVNDGSESSAKIPETAGVSGSIDENTGAVPTEQSTEAGTHPGEAAEATDSSEKKATFASSLLKNVISKKMQFEQERKTGQEENTETVAVCQNSNTSEAASLEESSRRNQSESNAEQRNDAALLPSENSAFRTWKNGLAGQTGETAKPASAADNSGGNNIDPKAGSGKNNKTSQLFVPKIQHSQPTGQEPGKQVPSSDSAARVFTEQAEGGVWKMRAGYKPAMSGCARGVPASRSPEIKISVRTVNDAKAKPFNIASLLTPNIGFSSANQIRPGDNSRSRALIASLKGEWAERTPHFMVRDIRDNKYKLLTPIHQVRDVRKLVKSSYHFVSLENQEKKAGGGNGVPKGPERKNMALFSPMVIKCHSVNTNSGPDMRRAEHLMQPFRHRPPPVEEACEREQSPPPPHGAEPPQRRAGQTSSSSAKQSAGDTPETQQKLKQDSVAGGNASGNANGNASGNANGNANGNASGNANGNASGNANGNASGNANRKRPAQKAALEKLQAAVRTMEELYVFDRKEWRRRTQAPQPVADSHVLSLITRQEHAQSPPPPPPGKSPPSQAGDAPGSQEGQGAAKTCPLQRSAVFSHRNAAVAPGNGQKTPPSANKTCPLPSGAKAPTSGPKSAAEERGEEERPAPAPESGGIYLNIPVDSGAPDAGPRTTSPPKPASSPGLVMLPVSMGTHALALPSSPAGLPQVMCFAQATPPLATPPADPAQPTQRKVLLDPTTGQYYLVDTPLAPATRKLYDPETGRFMDVPAPPQPATPVSLPLSPLSALSPLGAAVGLSPCPYATAPTYLIYPSLLPPAAPAPAPRTLRSRLSTHSDDGNRGDAAPAHTDSGAAGCPQSQPAATRGRESVGVSSRQPHGPRIVAPPSFDGATVSFVVEHR